MIAIREWKPQVAQICSEVAEGAMTLEQFHQAWPPGLEESQLAQAIFDDLEDGVEHFPGTVWTGSPDYDSWRASDMHRRIRIDLEILRVDADESRLTQLRDALIAEPDLPIEEFASRIAQLTANTRL
jgi:hypothetical protein